MDELIASLRKDNYCLMTNDDGSELYDNEGNLLVFKPDSEELLAIPNVEPFRSLYELPLEDEDKYGDEQDETSKRYEYTSDSDDDTPFVWMGQRTKRCEEATQALLELFDSPMYQSLMNDKNIVKAKVWEKIAVELQEQGFKIARTAKEAGSKTFQKWRNMERTYWKVLRNPEECGEFKRRKKPLFFDGMHAILSKRNKYDVPIELNPSGNGSSNVNSEHSNQGEDAEMVVDVDDCYEKLATETFPTSRTFLPFEVDGILISLVTVKYKKNLATGKLQQIKVWDRIYEEVAASGYPFATTKREGAIKLLQRWKILQRNHLRQLGKQPKRRYGLSLIKSIVGELAKLKSAAPDEEYTDVPLSSEMQMKNGETMCRGATVYLLKLMNSDRYQVLFSGGGQKHSVWSNICEEITAQGFFIAGNTKKAKRQRLFQKWRNLKRVFINYQTGKEGANGSKKPLFYDLLLPVMGREILNSPMPNSVREELSRYLGHQTYPHMDHDYDRRNFFGTSGGNRPTDLTCIPDMVSTNIGAFQCGSETSNTDSRLPSHASDSSKQSLEVLKQIKTLHETAITIQKQNFSRVVSLLEEQIKHQKTLNNLFTDYVTNLATKKKSEKSSKNNNKHSELSGRTEKSKNGSLREEVLNVRKQVWGPK